MGNVKIPYYRVKGGNGFEPTPKMKAAGFRPRPLGVDGPETWKRAWGLYEEWQRCRRGEVAPPERQYLLGSVGEAWERYRRTEGWQVKAQGTRREWEYAWGWIEPDFVDVDPNTIELEMMEALRSRVRNKVSEHAAHKVIKVWRAFWTVMAAMRYCEADADPSKGIRNTQPKGRSETWSEGEVARLAKRAWRMRLYGLSAIIGVIWDTQFSPGDARSLLGRQQRRDRKGTYYTTTRGKTRKEAIGTISRRVARLVDAYLKAVGIEVHDDASIFRDARGKPYTMFTLRTNFGWCVGPSSPRTNAGSWTCAAQGPWKPTRARLPRWHSRARWQTRSTCRPSCKTHTCRAAWRLFVRLTMRAAAAVGRSARTNEGRKLEYVAGKVGMCRLMPG